MKTNNGGGWLDRWEAETEERAALAVPVLTRDTIEEPYVDDFGGRHCPECSTVHGEPDACPGCGAPVP